MYNCDPYNVLLAIATNIAALFMTASVLQRHISSSTADVHLKDHLSIQQSYKDMNKLYYPETIFSYNEGHPKY